MSIRHDFGAVVDLEEKALQEADACWTFTGYSSIFGSRDLGNDVVVAGAFAKSLRENGLPLLLFQHKMDDAPVGTIIDAKEDKRGLWIKGELPKDDTFVSGRLVPQLKRRGLKGMSIGYKVKPSDTEKRKEDGARMLKQIRLYECSFVSLPMHPDAGLESIKGFVPYQDLRIDKIAKTWDAAASLKRLVEKFGDSESSELRRAFLYADEEKSVAEWDTRLLVADVDEKGELAINPIALYKSVAAIAGARGGLSLPEDAEVAVKSHVERYYSKLNLEAPSKSFSVDEYDALDPGEREARLRGIGLSRKLAIRLSAQRDAERAPVQRDAGSPKELTEFLTAMKSFAGALNNSVKG